MPKNKVTRKDVAKYAGVSETVVSYVLNGNRYVKEEKKKRVLEAVEALHYQPNSIARALHGKGSMQILFIAEELESGYFPALVGQMGKEAYSQGYMISLCESREGEEFVSRIISRQFDGLIISAASVTDRQLLLLSQAGIPMVILENRRPLVSLADAVRIDTGLYAGSRACVRYLADIGCKNLVYVDKPGSGCREDLHFLGFLEEMKKSGLTFKEEQLLSGCQDMKEVEEQLWEYLTKYPETDGVVARYDALAAAAMAAAKRAGRRIPEELSVTGFDNDFISSYLSPSLTTVEIHKKEVGKKAMEALIALIGGKDCEKRPECPATLIVRESTKSEK